MGKITHDEVVGALKEVYDPEITVNVLDPDSYTHLKLPTKREV